MSSVPLWEVDPDLFASPQAANVDDHSPEWDAAYRKHLKQRRARFDLQATVADPDELLPRQKQRRDKLDRYFKGKGGRKKGNPVLALPECSDFRALADSFGAKPETFEQAECMAEHGLKGKAKRFLLCGRLGHRVNCSAHPEHTFHQPFMCRCRYCQTCGPAWFRRKFSDLVAALDPIIIHLLHYPAGPDPDSITDRPRQSDPVLTYKACHTGTERDAQTNPLRSPGGTKRTRLIAKIDFTVRNDGAMPRSVKVREFHRDMRDFWRFVERILKIGRKEYGHAGCDEFGGSNTNLHRHSLYVGPILPQHHKELSALWSVCGLRGERRKEMLRHIRRHGLRGLWFALTPYERRFVSIKRAENFHEALAHALKYPAKFLDQSTPERLAQLEFAFHKTRRFSAGGAFYNVSAGREPGQDSPVGYCPKCGARLCEIVEPWVAVFALEAEGRADVEAVRREVGRAKIFSG